FRPAARVRQQGVVAQGTGCRVQVAGESVLQVKARQVRKTQQRGFQVGAQVSGAEVVGDLYQCLGAFLLHPGTMRVGQDTMRETMRQRALQIGARIQGRDRVCAGGHQSADSSSSLATPCSCVDWAAAPSTALNASTSASSSRSKVCSRSSNTSVAS